MPATPCWNITLHVEHGAACISVLNQTIGKVSLLIHSLEQFNRILLARYYELDRYRFASEKLLHDMLSMEQMFRDLAPLIGARIHH